MRQHENDILLCCDVKHKLVHGSDALSLIKECMNSNRGGDYQYEVKKKIIGRTVMTSYNNKNYRGDLKLNFK
jgi:aubergine